MIDSNRLIYAFINHFVLRSLFQPIVLQEPAIACLKTIKLLTASTFITVEILFAEYCLEVMVLILEYIRGLATRFDNGDSPILFAQLTAMPS